MKLFSLFSNPDTPVDGFPLRQDHPYYQEHLSINRFLNQLDISVVGLQEDIIQSVTESQPILKKDPDQLIRTAHALMERIAFRNSRDGLALLQKLFNEDKNRSWRIESGLCKLLGQILKRKIAFTDSELTWYLEKLNALPEIPLYYFPYRSLIGKIETNLHHPGTHPELASQLSELYERMPTDLAVTHSRIRLILEGAQKKVIEAGEPWSDQVFLDLKQMEPERRKRWEALLDHAILADGSKPTQTWLKQAKEYIATTGQANFIQTVSSWMQIAEKKVSRVMPPNSSGLLKGLVWYCIPLPGSEISLLLGDLALASFLKIPYYGARATKVGNACIYALGAIGGKEAVSQLVRIQQKVKLAEAQRLTKNEIEKLATAQQMSVTDLEDTSVPTFNLDAKGCFTQSIDDFLAEIHITSSRSAELHWKSTNGQQRETVPAVIKQNHRAELDELRKTVKSIEATLSAQCDRIERLLIYQPTWPFSAWQERYINHPVLSQIARRLIWHFSTEKQKDLGMWIDGQLVDNHQKPLDWITSDTQVRLWHPLGFDVSTVLSWRTFLEQNHITQPFKQAHRELYLLTDAELVTGTYSNRFASHILKQHQFAALCKQRGWRYTLQGNWDSYNIPTLDLLDMGLRVEFLVEPILEENALSGVFSYVTTDQVGFYNARQGDRLPLSEIPALLFSEIMRDVDLFVGVCSIGNDPSWQDGGEDVFGRDYWQYYAFGDLEEAAKNRKEVLKQLLPRLKIADRCQLSEKFLVVKGAFRTYKIHLGSANIRMEPNDEYLCIVPGYSTLPSHIYLPFEGDRILSIILSKAFLLADDMHIKDPTILRQITSR